MFDNSIFSRSGTEIDNRKTNSDRYNVRYKMLIEPINWVGKTVLNIGSHNGLWPAAQLHAGAKKVTGIECREELVNLSIQKVSNNNFTVIHDDMFSALTELKGQRFDIIFLCGTLLHTLYHLDLIRDISNLEFDLFVLDCPFWPSEEPMVYILAEGSTWSGNALTNIKQQISYTNPQQIQNRFHDTLAGIPSLKYTDILLEGFGLTYTQINYSLIESSLTNDEKSRTIDYLIKQTRILHIKKSQNFNNILTPVGEQLTKTDKEFGWDVDRVRTIIANELNNNYEYFVE
jgi:hypothetical protein